jgi:hypothetical protein
MIYAEAMRVLESEGLRVVRRGYGIEGWSDSPSGVLRFEIGRSSAGGDEVSIRRVGEGDPLSPWPVRWFFRPTLAELTMLLVAAQRLVRRGLAASLFDALLDLDRDESARTDGEPESGI